MHHARAKGLCEPEAVDTESEEREGSRDERREKGKEREREKLNIPGTSRDPGDTTAECAE